MNSFLMKPYAEMAKVYRDKGYWPRPLNGKKPVIKDWQKPDSYFSAIDFEEWERIYASFNIGLTAGSPFPDGTLLGFLDIDHDQYVELGRALLGNPECARIGKKGIVFPIRYYPGFKTMKKMHVKGEGQKKMSDVAEFLLEGSQAAIPPSIHPKTGRPYEWVGTPLHEIDFKKLPIIGE